MIQKQEELIQEDNRIPLIYTERTTLQADRLIIKGKKIPVKTNVRTWMFEVIEKTRVSETTLKIVNTLVNIIKWFNNLGNGKIDDSRLESRRNINQNSRIKGIGL